MPPPSSIAIALFRNDLRIHDNAVLAHLHSSRSKATHVLPLYVFDERQIELSGLPGYKREGKEAKTDLCGFWRTGTFRARFIAEAVYDLQARLRDRSSDLLIRFGRPDQVAVSLIKHFQNDGYEVTGVFMQKEVTSEEVSTEKALEREAGKLGVPITFFKTKPLVHPDDLPFEVSQTPDVFTPFRKRVEGLQDNLSRPTFFLPSRFRPLPPLPSTPTEGVYGSEVDNNTLDQVLEYILKPLVDSPGGATRTAPDARTAFPYQGGETAALQRLEDYFKTGSPPPVARYKTTRNGLLGEGYSTKLSPFLAHGCVSPRKVLECLKEHESMFGATKDTYWVLFELLWRDFFLFTAEKFGNHLFFLAGFEAITDPKQALVHSSAWKPWLDPTTNKPPPDLQSWLDGKTGVPFLDANLQELRSTGFMSNRGRQNVASFLAKDLWYDWRVGAEFFESNLIDHDPSANYGNWQYVAGVGNDPRASRQFNPIKQAKDYDPHGEYVKTWLPSLKHIPTNRVHTPWLLSESEKRQYKISDHSYPAQPILEQASWKPHYDRREGVGRGGGGRGRVKTGSVAKDSGHGDAGGRGNEGSRRSTGGQKHACV